jgi:hypothetical protein
MRAHVGSCVRVRVCVTTVLVLSVGARNACAQVCTALRRLCSTGAAPLATRTIGSVAPQPLGCICASEMLRAQPGCSCAGGDTRTRTRTRTRTHTHSTGGQRASSCALVRVHRPGVLCGPACSAAAQAPAAHLYVAAGGVQGCEVEEQPPRCAAVGGAISKADHAAVGHTSAATAAAAAAAAGAAACGARTCAASRLGECNARHHLTRTTRAHTQRHHSTRTLRCERAPVVPVGQPAREASVLCVWRPRRGLAVRGVCSVRAWRTHQQLRAGAGAAPRRHCTARDQHCQQQGVLHCVAAGPRWRARTRQGRVVWMRHRSGVVR